MRSTPAKTFTVGYKGLCVKEGSFLSFERRQQSPYGVRAGRTLRQRQRHQWDSQRIHLLEVILGDASEEQVSEGRGLDSGGKQEGGHGQQDVAEVRVAIELLPMPHLSTGVGQSDPLKEHEGGLKGLVLRVFSRFDLGPQQRKPNTERDQGEPVVAQSSLLTSQ